MRYDAFFVDRRVGMTAQQFNIDTIANNLANVNTGFKKSRVDFQDLVPVRSL